MTGGRKPAPLCGEGDGAEPGDARGAGLMAVAGGEGVGAHEGVVPVDDGPPDQRLSAQSRAVIGQFVEYLRLERGHSAHTVRAYASDLSDLFAHTEHLGRDLQDVTLRDLRSWLAAMQARGSASATLQRRSASARVFFAWLAEQGMIGRDPAAELKSPRVSRRLPRSLSSGEAAEMLAAAIVRAGETDGAAAERDVAILEMLYGSGLRVSELCGLDLGDIDRHARVVSVLGKGDKQRTVPVSPAAVVAVDRWASRRRSGWAGFGCGAVPRTPGWPDRPPGRTARGARGVAGGS